ncbi:Cytochrome P450 monooxygenase 91 [Psilocybe cubensis]|nr:Cytochrome P450 monooxygenase 91 [Psilocybe cubensis]KAH9485689.1 Cytochrome P450 monooxygenase 91 [Psilocybe cubensis]
MPPLPTIITSLAILWLSFRLIRRRLFPTALERIRGPPGESWITGSLSQLQHHKAWNFHQHIVDTYGSVVRTKGAFGADNLYLFDPKAMHHILVKDQHIYEETDSFIEGNKIMFGSGIFTSLGDEHRRHRKMLNPVFSSAHMRHMVPIFYDVTRKVKNLLVAKTQTGPQEIDVVSWMTRLAMEIIGQSGLGYTFDDLTENGVQHEYVVVSKRLVTMQGNEFIRDFVMPKIARIGTRSFRKFVVDIMPFAAVKEMKNIIDVLYRTSVEIFESKKEAIAKGDEALAAQVGKGKDIISILMKANMLADEGEKLSDAEVIAQITSLTFAATDTTSGALSRILHQLAMHPDVQAKLRQELNDARKANGAEDLDYDQLVSLPFLDAVCRETLRLYPPVSMVQRVTRQDAVLPLLNPIKDCNNNEIREIPLPKGTTVLVSILASNRDPNIWGPDAHEWKPERWLNPLPENLIAAHVPGIYSHLMTFLGGGRSCIGFKFSQLEMKAVISLLLQNLEFSLGRKKIIWQMFGIAQPNIDPDSVNPTMPMMISSVQCEA